MSWGDLSDEMLRMILAGPGARQLFQLNRAWRARCIDVFDDDPFFLQLRFLDEMGVGQHAAAQQTLDALLALRRQSVDTLTMRYRPAFRSAAYDLALASGAALITRLLRDSILPSRAQFARCIDALRLVSEGDAQWGANQLRLVMQRHGSALHTELNAAVRAHDHVALDELRCITVLRHVRHQDNALLKQLARSGDIEMVRVLHTMGLTAQDAATSALEEESAVSIAAMRGDAQLLLLFAHEWGVTAEDLRPTLHALTVASEGAALRIMHDVYALDVEDLIRSEKIVHLVREGNVTALEQCVVLWGAQVLDAIR